MKVTEEFKRRFWCLTYGYTYRGICKHCDKPMSLKNLVENHSECIRWQAMQSPELLDLFKYRKSEEEEMLDKVIAIGRGLLR